MTTTEPRRRVDAHVSGRVQGVGFRVHVARSAARHDVVGWVANDADGGVHAVGEGTEMALVGWLRDLEAGPPAARVSAVDAAWSASTGEFRRFEIRSGWHGGD